MGWVFFLIKTSATYALSVLVAKSPYCYSIENLYVHQEWGEIIFPLYYIHHLQTKQLIIYDCSVNKKRHQKKIHLHMNKFLQRENMQNSF